MLHAALEMPCTALPSLLLCVRPLFHLVCLWGLSENRASASHSAATGLRLEVSMTAHCITVWPRCNGVLSCDCYRLVLCLVTPLRWYLMAVLIRPGSPWAVKSLQLTPFCILG